MLFFQMEVGFNRKRRGQPAGSLPSQEPSYSKSMLSSSLSWVPLGTASEALLLIEGGLILTQQLVPVAEYWREKVGRVWPVNDSGFLRARGRRRRGASRSLYDVPARVDILPDRQLAGLALQPVRQASSRRLFALSRTGRKVAHSDAAKLTKFGDGGERCLLRVRTAQPFSTEVLGQILLKQPVPVFPKSCVGDF